MVERYPVDIAVTAERALAVRWDDDHGTVIPLTALRDACPCATCRQARRERAEQARATKRRSLSVLGVATRYEVTGLEHVGRYALGVSWRDDHRSIYAWEYLAGLCPCAACDEARGGPPEAPAG